MGFAFGAILGSFAKATAEREIRRKSLKGRSYCPKCKKTLRWYDLFPVFSFIFLRGRCRYCASKIPLDDFLTEVVLGILVGIIFFISPLRILDIPQTANIDLAYQLLDLIFRMFLVTILTIIFWVDLKSGLIPDKIVFPAILITTFYLVLIAASKSYVLYYNLQHNALGVYLLPPHTTYLYDRILRLFTPILWSALSGAVTALSFILLIVITRGKGMGWGDVKYVIFLGLALGFPNTVVAIMLAFFIGAVFSLLLIAVKRKQLSQTIPFGPFLSLGAVIALCFGSQIIAWYMKFTNIGFSIF